MDIFFTKEIPSIAKEMLEEKGNSVTIGVSKGEISKRQLKKHFSKEYDAIVTLLTDTIDEEVLEILDTHKKTKVIANYAVGFENIDIEGGK